MGWQNADPPFFLVWLRIRLQCGIEIKTTPTQKYIHTHNIPLKRFLNFTKCFFKKVNTSNPNSHLYLGLSYFNLTAFQTAESCLHLGGEIGGEKGW